MGIDAIPPPTSGLPARLVLGPALRTQSDGRLVRLVREGYESAFEEIVRRYRRPLDRFAASIVGGRSEDVTQDSFRKALEALRDGDAEVELRPWLYRIVRNTALNDLRDRPPAAAELAEELVDGGRSAAAEAEQREQVETLVARLRALPERQRAALVMRELEGMGHEEIAAALGVSGGAARQAIARGRAAIRGGFGALVPLPLLRALANADPGIEAGAAGASGAVGGASAVGATGGAVGAAGGAALLGGGGALKAGLATLVVAGSVGAGVAIHHSGGAHHRSEAPKAAAAPAAGRPASDAPSPSPALADSEAPVPRREDHTHGGGSDHGSSHREDRHGRPDDHGGHRGGGRGSSSDDRIAIPPSDDAPESRGGDRSGSNSGSGSRHDGGTSGGSGHGGDTGSGSGRDGGSDGGSSRGGDPGQSNSSDGSRGGNSSTGRQEGSGSTRGGDSSGGGSGGGATRSVASAPPTSSTSGGPGPSSDSSGGSGSSGGDDVAVTPSPATPTSSGSSGGPPSVESPVVTDEGSGGGSGGGSGSSGSSGSSEISP